MTIQDRQVNTMTDQKISVAVIRRLPRYYRYLNILIEEGTDRISSAELSHRMNVTASQIRQDLNHFGGFGQQGYGYNVKYLHSEIGKVLGLDKGHSMAIIGIGNFGKALARNKDFASNDFYVKSMFDSDPAVIGREISGITVQDASDLITALREDPVDIAVLTVPKDAAALLADMVIEAGVKAIWNFAHCELEVPDDIVVENVYLIDSLMRLSYKDSHRSHK